MGDVEPRIFKLGGLYMLIYKSGIRRGHAECLKQIASQLKEAAMTAMERGKLDAANAARIDPTMEAVANAYEKFAGQLEGPAAEAAKEQQVLLDRFLAVTTRSVADRLKAAVKGALGGWRGW